MELDHNKDRYILTEKEKQSLVWRIEHYKQKGLKYLPLNYKMSKELKEILLFIEELTNSARRLQQCMTIAAMQEADTIQERTISKMQKQEKERHAKGGLAKGEKNKLFKEFILREYDEKTIIKQ